MVPTYKRPQLLLKCLAALNRQNFPAGQYEVLVVSDGPDEATASLITNLLFEYELRYIATNQKSGPAAARNVGWQHARGLLIAFTDDDCIPDSSWLTTIWKNYQGQEEVVFTGKVVVPVSQPPTDYEVNISNLETAEFVTANCICTKKALLKTGGFDERFKMAWREDSDLHFKLLENGIPIQSIPAVVVHPVRKAPWGISIKEQKKGIFNALLYKKYPVLYRQRIKAHPSWNYYLTVSAFLGMFILLTMEFTWGATACALLWLAMVLHFTRKRLERTSRSLNHIAEMLFTSMVIPFLSVYWQLYGALKFKTIMI